MREARSKRRKPIVPPRRRRRPRTESPRCFSLLVPALAVVVAATVAVAWLSVGSTATGTRVSQRTVAVTRGVVQSIVSGSGNLAPAHQSDVDFQSSGRITHIYTRAGRHVEKGELLARLDPRSAQVAVSQAQATLADDQDKLDAIVNPAPTPSSDRSAAASATATPGAASQESAQAAVDSAQLALEQAEADLDATELRAPMAGTVASVDGEVGDQVGGSSPSSSAATGDSGGSSAFIVLAQLSRLTMEVQLSESDISKVRVGQPATVTVNAASGEKLAAHVSSIGVLAASSSSSTDSSSAVSYPVTVTLDQSTAGLKAGMSATADIVTAQASGLTVPNQALRGSAVTVERDGRRTTQRVATGVAGDSSTQIVSGLQAGDEVLVTSTTATLGRLAGSAQQQSGGLGRGAFGGGGFGGGGFGGGGLGGGGRFGGGGAARGGP